MLYRDIEIERESISLSNNAGMQAYRNEKNKQRTVKKCIRLNDKKRLKLNRMEQKYNHRQQTRAH